LLLFRDFLGKLYTLVLGIREAVDSLGQGEWTFDAAVVFGWQGPGKGGFPESL
jgi:hypothetical protein